MKARNLIFILLASLISVRVAGQHKRVHHQTAKRKAPVAYFNTPEDWYKQVQGKPFPLKDTLIATNGKPFDFAHLKRPVLICFGFAACPPCRHELPVYRAAAALHPAIDFVYITYDSEATRLAELTALGLADEPVPGNYYVLHLSLPEIDRHNLTLAYPTQYFVTEDGLVRYMHSGGDPDEPIKDIQARIERIVAGKE